MYLANPRSFTVLSTLASSTLILIGDCLLPLQAEKYVNTKFKYSKVHIGWDGKITDLEIVQANNPVPHGSNWY